MGEIDVLSGTQRIIVSGPETVRVVSAGPPGPPGIGGSPGPTGPTGPAGPTGPGGGDPTILSYRHVQSSALPIWTIHHDLGYKPGGVFVVDSAGVQQIGRITHIDNNTLTIAFFVNNLPASFGGEAELS